jgi:hypothetical protein
MRCPRERVGESPHRPDYRTLAKVPVTDSGQFPTRDQRVEQRKMPATHVIADLFVRGCGAVVLTPRIIIPRAISRVEAGA